MTGLLHRLRNAAMRAHASVGRDKATKFPLPVKSLRVLSGGRAGPYVIVAMFTASYSHKADRLIASCEKTWATIFHTRGAHRPPINQHSLD
jgi:hypothetical protein